MEREGVGGRAGEEAEGEGNEERERAGGGRKRALVGSWLESLELLLVDAQMCWE